MQENSTEPAPETERIRILYVDDEQHNLISFKAALRRDYNVITAISAEAAMPIMQSEPIDIVVSDQRMPGMTGVEFFQQLVTIKPEPMRILLTGYSDIQAVIDAINKGEVYRYLTKPWEAGFMKSTIDQAYEVLRLRRENKQLVEELKRANSQLEFYLRQKLLS